jgi:putative endonuclease
MFYVYIIRSRSLQRYYVGSTQNIDHRLQEYNVRKSKSTRAGVPWELVHTEKFATCSEAVQRERKIKARGIGRYLSNLENKRLISRGAFGAKVVGFPYGDFASSTNPIAPTDTRP